MTQKNITVYYQKDWNPYAKYTEDFSKTHTKVFEGTITNVENQEDVFSAFNNDYANPLSYTNETNKVCVIGDGYGSGKDFQQAMKDDKVECGHTSMSVGDIVEIDGVCFLCQDFGWHKFTKKEAA